MGAASTKTFKSEVKAALGCVGAVVGPLALSRCRKDRSHVGQKSFVEEYMDVLKKNEDFSLEQLSTSILHFFSFLFRKHRKEMIKTEYFNSIKLHLTHT